VVALQVVHPSAKGRPFGGTSHTFPIFVGDLLEIRNKRYAFLPGRSLGIACFHHFSLYVPLAVIAFYDPGGSIGGMQGPDPVMEAHRDLPRGEKHDPVPDLLTSSAYRYLCGETLQAID